MTRIETHDYRHVQTGHVFVDNRRAATLTRDAATITFAYTADYLDRPGQPVATTLPLTDQPVVTHNGAVPAFFAGLLPEGRRLTFLRRAAKTSADDELTLLLACGSDPVGNVQVLPTPENVKDEPGTLDGGGDFDFSDITFGELLSDVNQVDPSALAGVQDKVSGRMLTVPMNFGGRCHLLKLQVPEYPYVIENEAFFLQRAQRLRGQVVQADVVQDKTGHRGLLVTRFDRVVTSGKLQRLAVEDSSQIVGVHPAEKYSLTTEQVVVAVAEACQARPVAALASLRQVLYAWVTGNGDLHAKNLSIVGRQGIYSVAPMYDLPSTYPYGDRTMALTVAGKANSLSGKRFLELAANVGLPERAAKTLVGEVLKATEGLAEEIDSGAIPFDRRQCKDLARVMRRRRQELEPAL